MLNHPPMLLALDIGEVIGSLGTLALLVLWVVRKIFEANKEAAKAPQARPQAPLQGPLPQGEAQAARQPAAQQAGQKAGQQADPLRSQVEEFLRRAGRAPQGERPAPAQRRPRPAGTNEIEVLIDEEATSPERRPLAEPFKAMEQRADSRAPQPLTPREPRPPRQSASPRRESVAEHAESVTAHSRAVAEQASRLGQRIIEDDQQFDIQLRAKFDHTVGTLTGSAVTAAEQAAAVTAANETPAAHIADLLSNPAGVRQAIIVNEIFRAAPAIDGKRFDLVTEMPLYEYLCPDCDRQSELLVQGSEQPVCPECGGTKLNKLLSIVSAPSRGAVAPGRNGGPPPGSCGASCACHPHG